MDFAEFFKEWLKDEGITEDDIWNMSLSQYDYVKVEAWQDYKKVNKNASYFEEFLEV